jgi:Nucleotidyl transferase AbiEii toxin, Type IV TA system
MLNPRLEILPQAQQNLWPELAQTPPDFTLYGGTAIALRLGHRFSVDFDFFSTQPFVPAALKEAVPYLDGSIIRQSAANTLTVSVERGGPVQLSYFGGLRIGQVEAAETVAGPRFAVSSLLDLAGMKVAVVTQRAEVKDYLDIHALLTEGRFDLATMLAAAAIIYGDEFNPLIALKAISYHDDPALADLSPGIRSDLLAAVRATRADTLPRLTAVRQREPRR